MTDVERVPGSPSGDPARAVAPAAVAMTAPLEAPTPRVYAPASSSTGAPAHDTARAHPALIRSLRRRRAPQAAALPESPRVEAAKARAAERLRRRVIRVRLLLLPILGLVVGPGLFGRPRPGLHGQGLVVAICLTAFTVIVAIMLLGMADGPLAYPLRVILPLLMGASSVGLMATQSSSSTELPGATAVVFVFMQMPLLEAMGLGGAIAAAVSVTLVVRGGGDDSAAATLLLCATLALMAVLVRRSREGEDQAERLMAQLEDAREEQAKAAALAERGRIARDLHDVLAQSISGLAIQIEAARSIARRDKAGEQLREILDRASVLARDGLSDARRAVGALRGDSQPTLELLPNLIERYRGDLRLDVSFQVLGTARPLSAAAGESLYRGTQEALTNAARYARAATVSVVLEYRDTATIITVDDVRPDTAAASSSPSAAADDAPVITGSGLGLRGMAERIEQAGGTVTAGPTPAGWRVRMEIPA